MLGYQSDPGVMILTVEDLFRRIEERKAESTIKVTLSMLEVYNETIRDLLSPEGTAQAAPGGLDLREDPNLGVVVAGLSEHTPETVEQVLQLLATGNGCAFNPPFLPSSCFQARRLTCCPFSSHFIGCLQQPNTIRDAHERHLVEITRGTAGQDPPAE